MSVGSAVTTASTPLHRVRRHLHTLPHSVERDERPLAHDLLGLLGRLRRLQARGAEFREVKLSEHVTEIFKRLEVVGSDLLLLTPERKGA